jgi:hypothetical protein
MELAGPALQGMLLPGIAAADSTPGQMPFCCIIFDI